MTQALLLRVRVKMHVREVQPHEKRLAGVFLALDEILRGGGKFVVAGLHALGGQRAGVGDFLFADLASPQITRMLGFFAVAMVELSSQP